MDGSGIVLAGQTQVPLPTQTKGSVSGSWSTSARQQTLLGCVVGQALEPPPPPFPPVATPPEPIPPVPALRQSDRWVAGMLPPGGHFQAPVLASQM